MSAYGTPADRSRATDGAIESRSFMPVLRMTGCPKPAMCRTRGVLLHSPEPIFQAANKVDIPAPFSLSSGENLEITLDFDAALSVQVNQAGGQHSYILHPVIHVVDMN